MNETAATGIAVLRTRLPYVDRRSLSQAWFSALHLANGGAPAPRAEARESVPTTGAAQRARDVAGNTRAAGPSPAAAHRYVAALRAASLGGSQESTSSRATRPVSVRRATVAARSYPVRRTSLTVGVDGGRVQLLLRREGDVLHVIALCRPDVAERVRRALASAAAHLYRSGDAMRSCVRTLDAERIS